MPQVQFIYGRDRWSLAKALAKAVAVVRDERPGRQGTWLKRALYVAWDVVAALALCLGLFLFTWLAMVLWG